MRYTILAFLIIAIVGLMVACDEAVPTSPDASAVASVAAEASQARFAKHPVKTATKACEVGQTITWDGEIWVCTDLPTAAVAGWEFQKNRCTVPADGSVGCWATCNPGKKILGGGYSFLSTLPREGEVQILRDKPIWVDEVKAWHVWAVNYSDTSYRLEVYGICARMETDF
jgi:hypothetical protein